MAGQAATCHAQLFAQASQLLRSRVELVVASLGYAMHSRNRRPPLHRRSLHRRLPLHSCWLRPVHSNANHVQLECGLQSCCWRPDFPSCAHNYCTTQPAPPSYHDLAAHTPLGHSAQFNSVLTKAAAYNRVQTKCVVCSYWVRHPVNKGGAQRNCWQLQACAIWAGK